MRRRLFTLLLILAITLQGTSLALAQTGDEPGNADNQVFMPLVTGGQDRPVADPNTVTPLDDAAPSLLSSLSLAKTEVGAAARGVDALQPVSLIVRLEDSASPDPVLAVPGVKTIHRYTKVFNGLSLITTHGQLEVIKGLEGVAAVYVDQLLKLNTDASNDLMGSPAIWSALGGPENAGEGVVVGILDSGIWPEHPSLSDPDPSGKPFAAPEIAPGSNGFGSAGERSTCDFGNTAANPADEPFTCNNKLIGAYAFLDTYKAFIGLLPTEFDSARDDNGHGTHTATTAAGNGGVAASIFGKELGVVSGVAPRAHVIAYRVCGNEGCFQSDSIAAVEQAILDGVDSINFSIGGGNSPYGDPVELAFLEAYDNGVFVSASAGNSGPGPNTTGHNGPWVMNVAASTNSRYFLGTLTLQADNGDELVLQGGIVTDGWPDPTPVVIAPDPQCIDLPEDTFNGEIVICDRGVIGRPAKSLNVQQAGGSAMLLRNLTAQGQPADNCFIPCMSFEHIPGQQMVDFVNSHTGVVASFTEGANTPAQADIVVGFSSRGGPGQTLGVSKPDVTAPGVHILAGHTAQTATPDGGPAGELFQVIMGTSMSSPHVAGAGALLKALHPDWTPGQIKSALMLTAKTAGVTSTDGTTRATAFDYGSGRVDLTAAGDPGITIDESAENYVALENQLWNANYPSIYIPNLPGQITVERTVKNVTAADSTWQVSSTTDNNSWVIEVPRTLTVRAGREQTFAITIRAPGVRVGQTRFGQIHLTDGQRQLHIPVTFVRGQAPVVLSHTCAPNPVGVGNVSNCRVSIQNTAFVDAQVDLTLDINAPTELIPSSVTGARVLNANMIKLKGVLRAQQPPLVTASVDPTASPAGYLSLTEFGGNTEVELTDESIVNFTVPDYVYAGEVYDTIGIVSNGYLLVGGGTVDDVVFANFEPLPSATAPNNILAPFWTDLNPEAGGQVLINFLTDGVNTWMIVEFLEVPNFTNNEEVNTFQVWIGIDGFEDISFTYGPAITGGDGGALTVGAENKFGNSGQMVYFNGDGQAPAPSFPNGEYEVGVVSVPGEPGAQRTIQYSVRGVQPGYAGNCARLTSEIFQGAAIACGKVRVHP
jgi:subtilisin family serine protease